MTNRILRPCILLAALTAFAIVSGMAHATDYYVDQGAANASDNNVGGADAPWKTLYRAMAAPLLPGDTVHVKPGTYDARMGGGWDRPVFNPSGSGTAEQPITIIAEPRHSVTLDNGGQENKPIIGSYGQSYIVWDGFVLARPGDKAVAIFGTDAGPVYGITIQNMVIHGVLKGVADNTDAIRLQYVRNSVVRNNRIFDVHNAAGTENAAAVKAYVTANIVVEHNEIYDVATGIYDKIENTNNIYRYNLIHDATKAGIYFRSPTDRNSTSQDSSGSQVYGNVIVNSTKAVEILPSEGRGVYDTSIFNNTFVDYSDGGVQPSRFLGKAVVYNNIFYRSAAPARGDIFTFDDPVGSIALSDYNLFVGAPRFTIGSYYTNRVFNSLTDWQSASGFDAHSQATEPAFANPGGLDFRLGATSPARGAGRTGGTPDGAVVNVGAYADDNTIVGILP